MFAIAPTDLNWFEFLKDENSSREINFWTPTPWGVEGLKEGDRLYFMLKAPIRRIGGYGVFVRYADMTASEAWSTYGRGNGVATLEELVKKVSSFAERRSSHFSLKDNPLIGCIELKDSVLLDLDEYVDPAECSHSFPKQVVKLKYFHEKDGFAERIGIGEATTNFSLLTGPSEQKFIKQKDRKGQSAFRQQTLKNYGYRCCISGETVVELLEAAHIQPYIDKRSNHPQNGLCLRVDLHRLFDEGLISISKKNTVMISKKLAGSSYEGLNGRSVSLPANPIDHPAPVVLDLHRSMFR